jgi:hypothetical protein
MAIRKRGLAQLLIEHHREVSGAIAHGFAEGPIDYETFGDHRGHAAIATMVLYPGNECSSGGGTRLGSFPWFGQWEMTLAV